MEFDEELQQRLQAFQKHVGLSGDGVAGEQTWQLLAYTPQPAPGGVWEPMLIPLSDYPELQAFLEAESVDKWLASLGIGGGTENEART